MSIENTIQIHFHEILLDNYLSLKMKKYTKYN